MLGEWTPEEWRLIEAMDAPFARFMDLLAQAEDPGALAGIVNAESFWLGSGIEP